MMPHHYANAILTLLCRLLFRLVAQSEYAEYLASLPPGGFKNDPNGGGPQMSCCCGGNWSWNIWLGNPNEVYVCCDGACASPSTEWFTFQDNGCGSSSGSASASIPAGGYTNCGCYYHVGIEVDDPTNKYFATNIITNGGTFTWVKPTNETNAEARRDFTFTYFVFYDANYNGKFDPGESKIETLGTFSLYVGYAEIKTVEFTGDHDVLRTNWKQEYGQWVWDSSYTYQGTQFSGPEWDATRKTNTGQYVSYGASYTKGSNVSVKATMEVDSGGRAFQASAKNGGAYMNFQNSPWTTAQGTVVWTVSSLTALPSTVAIVNSSIEWHVSTATSETNAGTSGNHTIFVTMGTPIQNYTTYAPPGYTAATYDNTTTEKRLLWAVTQTMGASSATGGTVSNPIGAAEKIVASIGHGYVNPMSTNWNAWDYMQNSTAIGDCGTMAALAVAGLGQIGVSATHELAYADYRLPITNNSCTSLLTSTFTSNGQTVNAKLIFAGNNFEAFFTVVDAGVTKAYTVYPKNGPIVVSPSDSIQNLRYHVLYTIGVRHVFWALDGPQMVGGLSYADMTPLSALWGSTDWPGYTFASPY